MTRIFIVDDDEFILKSLARILRRPGFEISTFGHAEEVLPRLTERPDLLICDYYLPKVNGLSIIGQAKAASPGTRTVLLSGGVEDDPVLEALEKKTLDRFATKPWHQEELVAMVLELLGAS